MNRRWSAIVSALLLPCAAVAQTAATPAAPGTLPTTVGAELTVLPEVNVIGVSPLLGSGVDRYRVPAETQVLTGRDVMLEGPPDALRALQDQAEGVSLDYVSSNPFQANLFYRGFQASPLQGTPQGLAVYLNGVRFNQAFGDTANWDLIPDIAIDRMNLEGANPVFGLNALGGALAVQLKNGFTYHGAELDAFGGSFGQIGGAFQYGKQSGNTAVYVAGSGLHEDGWREFQSSGLKQLYADLGWRSARAELHVDLLGAETKLNGPGPTPLELLAVDPRSQFAGPNLIANNYLLASVNGSVQANDTTSVQILAYYQYFLQRIANGNVADFAPCNDGSGFLCTGEGDLATDRNGNPVPASQPSGDYFDLDTETINTNGYGVALQVNNRDSLFGHGNHLVVGFSFDGADTLYDSNTAVGGLDLPTRNFVGPGVVIDQADGSIAPVRLGVRDAYYGAYATDIFEITSALSANLAGRFNAAQIDLHDQLGTALTGNHTYNHFNPAVGLTYKLLPGISLYGGWSESNRAPTPTELACASPASPCSLVNFFTGDPNLSQVIAHTIEVGLRGQFTPLPGVKASWNFSGFRTVLDNDILFVESPVLGRGFFQNVGTTERKGVGAGLKVTAQRWAAWIAYTYTDATFGTGFVEASPSNPAADMNGNIAVRRGNRLPGVPTHLLKLGIQYKLSDKWTVGATAVAASGQYLFGDEANLTPKLPGYFLLNLNSSYQITSNVQVFGLVQNALDQRYYTFGTFSPVTAVPVVQVPNISIARSYSLGAPIAAYGGIRVTF